MQGKFLGDTKGNSNLPTNRSTGGGGGHTPAGPSGKFIGPTKGNTNRPINRSKGGK